MSVGDEPVIEGLSGLRLIGRGRFSTVYRARQDGLARDVAVKVLHVDMSDPQARYQFLNECAATGQIGDHPNIVTVYDSGVTADGEPYLVMELCEQGSLADRLRSGPLDVPSTLALLVKLCDALATAHQAGILHRDIKPENILFTSYGEPALADFGVGSLTGQTEPTPNHAAPEVLDGARASAASDVYSLASTGYQILTGVPPFQRGPAEGLVAFFQRVVQDPVPPLARPDAPPDLVQAIARGLATDPDHRYATAAEFGHDLRRIQPKAVAEAVIPPPAPPDESVTLLHPGLRPTAPPPAPAPKPPARRRPWLVPVAGALALFLLLCGGVGYLGYQRFLADSPQTPVTGSPTQADPATGSAAAPTVEPTDSPTASPAEAPTATEIRSAAPPPPPPAQQTTKTQNTPTGPYVVYLRVKQQPSCPSGQGAATPDPGSPVTIEWKVAGGATGSMLSVDDPDRPGSYGRDYGTAESAQLSFPCGDWNPGEKATHTYTVTTAGGGPERSKTITVTAPVN